MSQVGSASQMQAVGGSGARLARCRGAMRSEVMWIMLLAFGVRLAYVLSYSRHASLGFDGNHYYELGRRIADHFSYDDVLLAKPTALFPPGYPAFLALGRIFGFGTRTKLLVLSGGLGSCTVGMIARLAREQGGTRVGVVAGVIAALYPNLFLADGALMTESLSLFLIVALLLLATRWRDAPTMRGAMLIGVALGWYCLTRSDGLVFAAVFIAVLGLGSRRAAKVAFHGEVEPSAGLDETRSPRSLRRGLVVVAIVPIFMITMWQVRNQQQMHAFVPIAVNSWAVVAGANCDLTYHGDRVGSWELPCVKVVEAAQRGHIGEIQQNRYARDVGIDYARGHVQEIPKVMLARAARTFGAYQPWSELEIESYFEGRSEGWSKAGYVMYLVMLACAGWWILGVVRARRSSRNRAARVFGTRSWDLFIAPAASVVISTALGYGNHRFRIPIEPFIVIAAACAFVAFVPARRRLLIGRASKQRENRV